MSTKVDVNIIGDVSFFNKMKLILSGEFEKAKKDILERVLHSAREESHRYKHRTRNLRNSTKIKDKSPKLNTKIDLVLYVDEAKAPYAKFIVNGHGSWQPDEFLEKAIDDNKVWIEQRLLQAMNNASIQIKRS